MFYSCRRFAIGFLLLMLLPGLANAAAGHFLFVYGKVVVTAGSGVVRRAARGMKVQEGETITSGISGTAQLYMKDGAFLAIRPNTVLRIDAYAYQEKGRKTQSIISLLKGTFRTISGKIGERHPRDDLVRTPVATIGIRGTDHEPAYIPPPTAGQVATVPPGAYDKVNKGKTFMQTNVGRINLGSDQVGYATGLGKAPVILPTMPAFYQTPDRPAVQEKKNNEGNGREKAGKEKAGKERAGKEKAGKERAGKEKVGKEKVGKEKVGKERAGKEKVGKEKVGKEKVGKEKVGTETVGTETGGKDKAGNSRGRGSRTGSGDQNGVSGNGGGRASGTSNGNHDTGIAPPSVVQTIKAASDIGTDVNLTDNTTSNGNGRTSDIGTPNSATPATPATSATPATPATPIATAVPATPDSAGVSWTGTGATPRSLSIEGAHGNTFTANSAGSITGWKFALNNSASSGAIRSAIVHNISGSPTVTQANHYATTGIRFGSYNASSVTQSLTAGGTTTDALMAGNPFNWIRGPGATPAYISQAYRATTAVFSFDGGSAFDETGTQAMLGGTIMVNFTKQALDLLLKTTATATRGSWLATASNVPLDGGGFSVTDQSLPASLNVSYFPINSNATVTGFGSVRGTLTGNGLTGIISSFSLAIGITHTLAGVAAFVNSSGAVNTAISHRVVGFASLDPRTHFANPNFSSTLTNGFFNNTGNITYDAAGTGITSFTSSLPFYYPSPTNNGINNLTSPVPTQLSTTGAVIDVGTDPVTGISWGRWTTGISDASLLSSTGRPVQGAFHPPDLHYLAGPATSQPVQLPVSGTFNYTLAGSTHPTDNLGNVGVLNSASLTANFTNMKVDVGINATVGATTLAATATGMPIDAMASFDSDRAATISMTCTGTCSAVNHGNFGGVFTGSTGNGAGLAYSLNTSNPNGSTIAQKVGTVISGVAAFHR